MIRFCLGDATLSRRRQATLKHCFIPTLFRDYHLYYIISILSLFSTVLGLIFLVIFSLSSLVLQNMLQLSLLNSTRWFTPLTFQAKKPNIVLSFFLQFAIYSPLIKLVMREMLSINSSFISFPLFSLFSSSRTSVNRSYTAL